MTEDIKVRTEFIKFSAEFPNGVDVDNLPRKWIPAAKVGQVVKVKDKICVVTAEALKSSLNSWKDGTIFDDHEKVKAGFKIYGDKYEDPFLYFELDEQTIKNLGEGEGGSIDAIATKIENQKILKMTGVGYSILRPGLIPSCTREAGCGIAAEGTANNTDEVVNISGAEANPNITIEADKVELKLNQNEGGTKIMGDKENQKEVTFSEEQVATIKAEAVKELTDNMTAQHKVEMTDLETAHQTALKTLSDTHVADLETQRVEVQKHVEMVDSLATKFALSPEARKTLIDAKAVEDVYALLETLKVDKAEPVIAAKGGATGSGIIIGTEVEAKAPETIKIEEIGSYNASTRKYEPTFREEVKE